MGHKLCIYAILSHKTPKKGKNSKITKNFNFERTEKYANHQKVPMFCQIRVQRTKIYNLKLKKGQIFWCRFFKKKSPR